MAKLQTDLYGNFNTILTAIDDAVMNNSASASLEDGSTFRIGDVSCAVRVYERYSMLGGNRVSLNVTLFGASNGACKLSAITSGGSQAVFFKINTLGEQSFLDTIQEAVARFER